MSCQRIGGFLDVVDFPPAAVAQVGMSKFMRDDVQRERFWPIPEAWF